MFWLTLTLNLLHLSAPAIASLPTTVLFQTTDGSSLENLAARVSSELLITSTSFPTLFTLDPTAKNPTLTGVVTFPNANALLGIGEIRPDVFAVVAAEINTTTLNATPGSAFIWTVDFTVSGTPKTTQAASIPQAGLANGLCALPGNPDVMLVADSVLGVAWGTFSRIPLAGGTVQQFETDLGLLDDFALDGEGRAWLATNPGSLTLIDPARNVELVVVNTTLNEPSSVAFGRVSGNVTTTFFVTTRGGQLAAVDTSGVMKLSAFEELAVFGLLGIPH
ncbi:hypothetical protein FB45DRAFT_1137960 [Roridomyces roridus]|uniref:SMP-30/Gluconolactonase/LRE-like region domain-containing protein n=1 Tax=Roridomyces roridus TaxID=1738132 RepID=A0AAD7C1E5_9AGAR|nr:hypothetical protein FB45DRAFT_1137960 [Roridomyces roridus]